MKKYIIHSSFLCLVLGCFDASLCAQLPAEVWPILQRAGRLVKADSRQLDDQGWAHYMNSKEGVLLLSVHTDGQNLGDPEEGLAVSVGLLGNYGHGAHDLSGADYIENSIWYTPNRYWKIQGALPISKPIRVRHYFDQTDLDDLKRGLEGSGYVFERPEELVYYAVQGRATHPFSPRIERIGAEIRMFEQVRVGRYGPYFYVELSLDNATAGGSFGFRTVLQKKRLQVEGRVRRVNGDGVEDAFFRSTTGTAVVRSGEDGFYTLSNLQAGQSYTLAPYIPGREDEGVGILDLIAMDRHLSGLERIKDPYRLLAADLNGDGVVDSLDQTALNELVLYGSQYFPNGVEGWRFVPNDYEFPAFGNPLLPPPPPAVRLDRLLNDRKEVDFLAVKLGDLLLEGDFANTPPVVVDPVFELPVQRSCGAGELVEIDLTIRDFHGLRGAQFTLEWDSTILEFVRVQEMLLPGLTMEHFGLKAQSSGKMSFAWYSPEPLRKKHLPDGTRVCQLVFKVIAQKGSSALRFTDGLTPVQVLNSNLSQGNALFVRGSVQIEHNSSLKIVDAIITQPRCGAQNGGIELEVSGGQGPYQYQWSHGPEQLNLSNLGPGVYQIQIKDGVQCPIISEKYVLESTEALRISNEHIRQVSCPGVNDGAINFKVEGGVPPYRYRWSNTAVTPWVGNLAPGDYSITVTDAAGCEQTSIFQVAAPGAPAISYGITPASVQGKSNGAISIQELIGRPGPFEYTWDTGQSGSSIQRLAPGTYKVTIADSGGCRFSLSLQLEAGDLPEVLDVVLGHEVLTPGGLSPIQIKSPSVQAVQVKYFDTRSNLVQQQLVPVIAGENHLQLRAPEGLGTYIVQFSAPKGGIRSLRCEVR